MDTYFVSSNGAEVKLRPIPMLALQMIRTQARARAIAAGKQLEPPTYTVVTAVGEKETYPHDETTLETDEDKAAWERYQADSAALNAAIAECTARLVLTRGLDVPPLTEAVIAEWRELGVEFSEDAYARYSEYIQLQYLPTPADLQGAIVAVLKLSMSGAPQEQLDAIDALFRHPVEGHTAETSGDAPRQLAL